MSSAKTIILSQGYEAVVDGDDFARVSQYKWHVEIHKTGIKYASRNIPHPTLPQTKTKIRLHRFILNSKPHEEVDHWDGDGLNNQRSNLRTVDKSTNLQNKHNRKYNTSGFRGISLTKEGKWRAHIRRNGKWHYLGHHATKEAAARAYDAGAIRFYGANARVNFEKIG